MVPWKLLALSLVSRNALINFGFGDGKQAIRETAERLIFLRRSAHSSTLMIRRVPLTVAAVVFCGCTIALEGQSKTPNNQTPAQTQGPGNPPSQQPQTITVYEVGNASPNEPIREEEKSYGQQFVKNLATDPVVWLTVALTFLAMVQLAIYRREIGHTKATERAYFSIDFTQNGLVFQDDERSARVRLKISNVGQTPGDVLKIVLGTNTLEALPPTPSFDPADFPPEQAFLVAGQSVYMPLTLTFDSTAECTEIRLGLGKRRWSLLGYIEYPRQVWRRTSTRVWLSV